MNVSGSSCCHLARQQGFLFSATDSHWVSRAQAEPNRISVLGLASSLSFSSGKMKGLGELSERWAQLGAGMDPTNCKEVKAGLNIDFHRVN